MKTKNKRIYVLSVECFQDILVMIWPQFTVISSYSVCDNSTVTVLLAKKAKKNCWPKIERHKIEIRKMEKEISLSSSHHHTTIVILSIFPT